MDFISCLHPNFIINPYTHERMCVPCGKCDACLQNRSSHWATRLEIESRNWPYVVFFTLTYNDEYLPRFDVNNLRLVYHQTKLENYVNTLIDSDFKDFIKLNEGKLPCFSTRHIQLFIKRLRKYLYEHETEENQILRYHVCCEYGPSTFRPHYHGLLFFRSKKLALCVRERVYKAWSSYNPHTQQWSSYGRIDAQPVQSSAASYVAKYTSFISCLPKILQLKELRPFQLHSSQPPIGYLDFSEEQVREVFHRALTRISIRLPKSNEIVSIPLWRSVKDKLFPKIKEFNRIPFDERIVLYRLPKITGTSDPKLAFRLVRLWHDSLDNDKYYLYSKIYELFGDYYWDFDYDSFVRFYRQVNRVCVNAYILNVSVDYYVKKIVEFYKNVDYENLKLQIEAEKLYCEQVPIKPLNVLPFLIDPLFQCNGRNLSSSVYHHYLDIFKIRDNDYKKFNIFDTEEYKSLVTRCQIDFENSKKLRAKNEYVNTHPYALNILKSLNL